MEKIKFGIIGCGNIGKRHAEHIHKNKRAELFAICDIVKERADELAKKYIAKSFYNLEEMLNQEFDVLNICTPSGLHAEMSIKGLEGKRHVLCEKPMTLNLYDADRVVEAEKKNNKKFFLVKQNRYNPPIKVLKDMVYNSKLGKISIINCNVLWNRNETYFKNDPWRGTMKLDGGALMTQASHFLDLMIWIGGKVENVYGKMANIYHPYIETEDTGFITLAFKNGCIGALQYTTCAYKKNIEGSMTVIGSNGNIKVGGKYLNTLEYWDVKDIEKPKLETGNPPNDYGTYKGSMSNHDKVIENVINVLLNNEEIATNSLQGRESVEVMQAAYLSALKNEYIKVPLKEEYYNFKINEQDPISGHKGGI
jgi:predicted dehydrogenase